MRSLISKPLSRRSIMKSAVAAGLASVSGGVFAPVYAQERTIKIAYISLQSDSRALCGGYDSFIIDGMWAAVKDGLMIGGKAFPIEIISKDNQSNPNHAAEVADELLSSDKVDLILAIAAP